MFELTNNRQKYHKNIYRYSLDLYRCARRERWDDIQTWFDYWEMYQTEDDFSFFSLLGRANKIEGMLLSVAKCLEIGNTGVAKMLKTNIQQVSQVIIREWFAI